MSGESDFRERLPTSEECTVRPLLDRHAAEHPEAPFAVFGRDLECWTYGDVRRDVRRLAALLKGLDVKAGDHVAAWLPTGKFALTAWLAINYIGGVFVPLNTAYRGRLLEHALELSDARVIFVHSSLRERLGEVGRATIEIGISETEDVRGLSGQPLPDAATLIAKGADAVDEDPGVAPWDSQAIIFTSGTTGPSKGVLVTYAHLAVATRNHPFRWAPDERGLLYGPLFHISGVSPVIRALGSRGSLAVLERFATDTFWNDVLRTGATVTSLMGSMAAFLLSRPPSEDERRTTLRTLLISPLTTETQQLAERIGADLYTNFSMSETALPIVTPLNPAKVGICGRPRRGVEARIVDAFDRPVASGEVGELILRTDVPWTISPGYYKNPEATARAWRNGWFHTGDAFRQDDDGDFIFVDRIKDAIRRRGENISSYEVELEVRAHPDVQDCAAIAVPSPFGEDDVLIAVEPKPGCTLEPVALFEFLRPRMAHFMLPRYIRLMSLPRTPTAKVQKSALRDDGVQTDTWDREAAGIRVRRDTLTA